MLLLPKWFCLTLSLLTSLVIGPTFSMNCTACDKEDANHPCFPESSQFSKDCPFNCFLIARGTTALLRECGTDQFIDALGAAKGECRLADGPTVVNVLNNANGRRRRRRRRSSDGQGVQSRAYFYGNETYTVCACNSKDLCNVGLGRPGKSYPDPNAPIPTPTPEYGFNYKNGSGSSSEGALHLLSNFMWGISAMSMLLLLWFWLVS